VLSSENLQEEQWRQVKELIWKEASNIRAVVMVCFCAAAFCLKKVSGFRKKKLDVLMPMLAHVLLA
jgi:hypothetical protein